jgi:hypothetical protein
MGGPLDCVRRFRPLVAPGPPEDLSSPQKSLYSPPAVMALSLLTRAMGCRGHDDTRPRACGSAFMMTISKCCIMP